MKLIHVISLLLVVIGGLHFALTAIGINLLGMVFGTLNMSIINLLIGLAIVNHVLPSVKSELGVK